MDTERDLIEARALIAALHTQTRTLACELAAYHSAILSAGWRHVGPRRLETCRQRLQTACRKARWSLAVMGWMPEHAQLPARAGSEEEQ